MRLTGAEKRRVEAAAARDDLTVAEWLRALLKRGLRDAEEPAAPTSYDPTRQ